MDDSELEFMVDAASARLGIDADAMVRFALDRLDVSEIATADELVEAYRIAKGFSECFPR